ncbi:MAG: LysR family transcriptional regulator [Lachnospiraceae bacterium]|nr:LysR family transcriptional regulator [Lachnospiraceae bacterium]
MEQNLSLYHVFYVVANTGNISRAASELYISQPAISKSISKLEENLNTTLFIRNSRGVTLTDEGRILYDYVKTAFAALERGEDELVKIQELGIGHIKIGVSTTLCKFILVPYLEEYIRTHPHVKVTIDNHHSAHTISLLEQHAIDLGVIAEPRSAKNIDFYPITEIEDIFVCSPSYMKNFMLRSTGHPDIITDGTVMMLGQRNMTRQHIDAFLSSQHMELNNILEISTMDLIIEFARIGMGVGCCIKECVQKELDEGILMQVPTEVPIPKRTIGFATVPGIPQASTVCDFIEFARKH